MKRTLVTLVLLIATTGCSTALVPGAEKVNFTRNPGDIASCKIVRAVQWVGGEKELRNTLYADGADTFLITRHGKLSNGYLGAAYNCSGFDPRQPVPVQPK
jgi:hypothetical protein